jgi:hypothetical protein
MPYILPVWVAESCILGGWFTAVLFNVLYTLKAPWWATWMGRNLFFFDLAVAMALTPGTLRYAFGVDIDGEFYQWFVVGDLVLVTALVIHRGYLLLSVQAGWNWYPLKKIMKTIRRRGAHDDPATTLAAVPDDSAGSRRSRSS